MFLPLVTQKALIQSVAASPPPLDAFFVAAITRGGAAVAAATFDMGLAKTRLEGLAYGTVTALVTSAALNLFKIVDGDNRKMIANDKFNNILKMTFGILCSSTIALGIYTTTIFTIIGVYSKTALGMGHTDDFIRFFHSCGKFRQYGFRSFVASLTSFSISWVCALLLTHENDTRWWIALPAIMMFVLGFLHYKELFALASTFVYSSASNI